MKTPEIRHPDKLQQVRSRLQRDLESFLEEGLVQFLQDFDDQLGNDLIVFPFDIKQEVSSEVINKIIAHFNRWAKTIGDIYPRLTLADGKTHTIFLHIENWGEEAGEKLSKH